MAHHQVFDQAKLEGFLGKAVNGFDRRAHGIRNRRREFQSDRTRIHGCFRTLLHTQCNRIRANRSWYHRP
jgi:hypothetical protein